MSTTDILMKLTLKGDIKAGATVQAVLLIGHSMESGFRVLDSGERVPKNVIERITATVNGELLFRADTGIGVSAHPYLAFPVTIQTLGSKLVIEWVDDKNQRGKLERLLA